MNASPAPLLPPLSLEYASYAQLSDESIGDPSLLGIVAFGAHPPITMDRDSAPFIWVNMPALGSEGVCEVWRSGSPLEHFKLNGVTGSCNQQVLFGALQLSDDEGLEAAGNAAYSRIFEVLAAQGFPHLLRTWNYFAGINAEANGLERYRRFNIGRHDAFATYGRSGSADMPAASALGCADGPLSVYFIAAKEAGRPVENPRQMSAYRYPEHYGPRSPTFSRAMLMQWAQTQALAISGTASITGHETRHSGDVAAQVAETMTNIETLIDTAGFADSRATGQGQGLLLKAYLRDASYLPIVQSGIRRTFENANPIYLQADICRSELLVEVEGLYTPPLK